MMRGKLYGLSFLLMVCATLLAACDGVTRLRGRVSDEGGNPIKGAKVILVSRSLSDEKETGEDGSFNLLVVHSPGTPEGTLTVSKDGYATYSLQFKSGEELGEKRDIVLRPAPSPAGVQK